MPYTGYGCIDAVADTYTTGGNIAGNTIVDWGHTTGVWVDDYRREPSPDEYQKHLEAYLKLKSKLWPEDFVTGEGCPSPQKKIEGVEMKTLYNVYLVYGEDRKKPIIKQARGVIANNDEDAKIKSGLMKEVQEDWDADYLTFIVEEIGNVHIKERPKEVKQV